MRISAVVVTYNRSALLAECLGALTKQTAELSEIVVVDNHSTDDTQDVLRTQFAQSVQTYRLKQNYGGAGGFYFGIKQAYLRGADLIWAMDDDTIPQPDALENLLKAADIVGAGNYSFLASKVLGEHGEPMNVPSISRRNTKNGYPFWYEHLEQGVVEIADATLVSLLFRREAVAAMGAPYKAFIPWRADYENNTRLPRFFAPALFVGSSLVIHKRKGAKALNFRTEDNIRTIRLSKYFYRNMLINLNVYGDWTSSAKFTLHLLSDALNVLLHQRRKWLKLKSIFVGVMLYLFCFSGSKFCARFRNLEAEDDMLLCH